MTAPTATLTRAPVRRERRNVTGTLSAFTTLTRRRLALSARTPRELVVPLLTPILFALVIAPALASIGPTIPGLDYMSFAAVGTVGLLIPLNCMFAGIGVILDRETGARRDLLAAPVSRPLIVLANLAVALMITALQVVVLVIAAVLRGQISTHRRAASPGSSALPYSSASRCTASPRRSPTACRPWRSTSARSAIAIVPFFFAGSLFPITALPWAMTGFARLLPLTHTLALMRYGLLDHNATGLHDIWGMSNATAMATLSLAVVAAYAAMFTAIALRTFRRSVQS